MTALGRPGTEASPLTGRLAAVPAELLHREILEPQFRTELANLFPHYIAVEQVGVLEYHRMGLITDSDRTALCDALGALAPDDLVPEPGENLSDIAFALERRVTAVLPSPVPRWHLDRSRNDVQACAQLMYVRDHLSTVTGHLLGLAAAARGVAEGATDIPMPGYTHLQAAQVITPGFWFAALSDQALHVAERLVATYDGIDVCPLGAGAMAGGELAWDLDRMARLLGFSTPCRHALAAVAGRGWVAEVTAELSLLGGVLGRFVTDLMAWGGQQYGFMELPDDLAGISSAMPQKKNYPVLERIRGLSAHLGGYHVDVLLTQRASPFQNMVEASKEASRHVAPALDTASGLLRLLAMVLDNLTLLPHRMRAACEREFMGGFTLANRLCLGDDVPWREAQVIAGRYITAAIDRGTAPAEIDPVLLSEIAAAHGRPDVDAERALVDVFDVQAALKAKTTPGSTHPDVVRSLLARQDERHRSIASRRDARTTRVHAALDELEHLATAAGR